MALDAGSVFVRLGARLEEREFRRYDQELERARRQRAVEAKLGAEVDRRAFDQYERALARARRSASDRSAFKAALGGEFDGRAFRQYERAVRDAERDTDRLGRSARGLGPAFGFAGTGASRLRLDLGPLGGRLSDVARTATILSPILLSLGGSATALAGSAGAAAVGLAGVGTSIAGSLLPAGALGIATMSRLGGVLDALKQQDRALEAAALDTGTALNRQSDAGERVRSSMNAVRDAREGLITAERAYKNAVRDAREEVERSRRSERDAAEALRDAEDELAAATSHEQRAAALERVRDAEERLRDARTDRAREEREGVRGDERVVSAAEGVRDAQQALTEAVHDVRRARDKDTQAAEKQVRAAEKLDYMTGQLTDTERDLLAALTDSKDVLERELGPATDAVLGGMADGIRNVTPLASSLSDEMEGLGNVVGREFAAGGETLAGDRWTRNFERLTNLAADLAPYMGDIAEDIAEIFVNVAIGAGPVAVDLMEDLADETERWARATRDTDRVTRFFRDMDRDTRSWVRLLREVGRLVVNVFGGGRDEGRDLVDQLTQIVDRWNDWLETTEGQREMRSFFRDSVSFARDLVAVLRPTVRLIAGAAREFLAWARAVGIADELGKALAAIALLKFTGLLAVIRGLGRLAGMRGALMGIFGAAGAAGAGGVVAGGRGGGRGGRGVPLVPLVGHPLALAVGGTALVAPAVQGWTRPRTSGFGLPRVGGGARSFLRDPLGNVLGAAPRAEEAMRRFGDSAERNLERFRKARNAAGLDKLAADARRFAAEGGSSAGAFRRFADAAEAAAKRVRDVGERVRTLRRIFGGVARVGVQDIIDPRAASLLAANLEGMRRNGVRSIRDLRQEMRFNVRQIGVAFQEGSAGWRRAMVENFGEGIGALRSGIRSGRIDTDRGMKEIRRIVRQQMRFVRDNMTTLSADAKENLARNFKSAREALVRQVGGMENATGRALKEIRRLMREELRLYGITGRAASLVIAGRVSGPPQPGRDSALPNQENVTGSNQRGGVIGGWGMRGRDDRLIRVAGGEFVATGWHQRWLNRALSVARAVGAVPFGSLRQLARLRAPHATAPGFQRGGYVQGARPPSGPNSGPIRALAERLFAQGFSATSGGEYRGTGTYHDRQQALDFGDSVNSLPRLWQVLLPMRARLAELFGPAHFAPAPSFRRGTPGGFVSGHNDHIHVAVTQALRGALGDAQGSVDASLPRVGIRGGGAFGRFANTVIQRIHAAAEQRLGEAVNSFVPPTAGGGGGNEANMSLGRQMMGRFFPASQWGALRELWTRESGWNHLAENPSSGAYGIPQSLPASKMASAGADWRTSPATQILWGLRYIRGRYGSPSAALSFHDSHNWYQEGGYVDEDGVPGFQAGGFVDGELPDLPDLDVRGGAVRGAIDRRGGFTRRGRRRLSRMGASVEGFERRIDRLDDSYADHERLYNLSEETLIIEPENEGEAPRVDENAVRRRVAELRKLMEIQERKGALLRRYAQTVQRLIDTYRVARDRLTRSLRHAPGKDRSGIRDAINDMRGRIRTWRAKLEDISDVRTDAWLDRRELAQEIAEVEGTTAPTVPPDRDGAGVDNRADLDAQLAQANQRIQNLMEEVRLSTAAVTVFGGPGSIGTGGGSALTATYGTADAGGAAAGRTVTLADGSVTTLTPPPEDAPRGGTFVQQNYMLHPADPAVLKRIAEASNAGNSLETYVPSPRVRTGL